MLKANAEAARNDSSSQSDPMRDDESIEGVAQASVSGLNESIHQAVEALNAGRRSVVRTLYAHDAIENEQTNTDPRKILHDGRQNILDRVNSIGTGSKRTTPYVSTLQALNRELSEHLNRLAHELAQGRIRPEAFRAQLYATLITYRTSVEHQLGAKVTLNAV